MKHLFKVSVVCLTLFAPIAANAQMHPAGATTHLRPVMFHDHSLHAHIHSIQPHH